MRFYARLAPTVRVIHAVNKVDLIYGGEAFDKLSRTDAPAGVVSHTGAGNMFFVSALTGQGIPELLVGHRVLAGSYSAACGSCSCIHVDFRLLPWKLLAARSADRISTPLMML